MGEKGVFFTRPLWKIEKIPHFGILFWRLFRHRLTQSALARSHDSKAVNDVYLTLFAIFGQNIAERRGRTRKLL